MEIEVGEAVHNSSELQLRCDVVVIGLDGESRHNYNFVAITLLWCFEIIQKSILLWCRVFTTIHAKTKSH